MDEKVSSAAASSGDEVSSGSHALLRATGDAPLAGDSAEPPRKRWLIAGAILFLLGLPALVHVFRSGTRENVAPNSLQVSFQKFQEKKYQESIDAAKEYLRINPASADAWNNIAVSDLMLDRYDEAVGDVMTALRIDPNNQLAKNNLSWISSERAKAKGGNAPPPPSVAFSHAASLLNVSLQQYNSGQFAACAESAKGAIRLDPNYAEAYNNLAACESASAHYDAAIAAAREALRLKPDFQLAKNNLVYAMQQKAREK